jgi:hypothetical protein
MNTEQVIQAIEHLADLWGSRSADDKANDDRRYTVWDECAKQLEGILRRYYATQGEDSPSPSQTFLPPTTTLASEVRVMRPDGRPSNAIDFYEMAVLVSDFTAAHKSAVNMNTIKFRELAARIEILEKARAQELERKVLKDARARDKKRKRKPYTGSEPCSNCGEYNE